MKILVTGGTGKVGGAVVNELLKRGAEVRVLSRKQPQAGKLPAGVDVAIGDLLDPVSVEQAMRGVDKFFLLNAVVPDELKRYGSCAIDYLKTRPGLTGLWQVTGRDAMDYPSRVSIDSRYVREWSLWADVVILVRTVFAVMKFDRAS